MSGKGVDAVIALESAIDLIYRFDTLFRAIEQVRHDAGLVNDLSGIGQKLVWENGNDLDVLREELQAKLN